LTGDGWVVDSDGRRHWGRHGAAGLLLWAPGPDGAPAVLLQRRALWCDHGGTWGLPGGARRSGETAEVAALRETREETGLAADQFRLRAAVVTARNGGWSYTTVVAEADLCLPVTSNVESLELRWVPVDAVDTLPLHPGLASAWPKLRAWMPREFWRWWKVTPDGVLASPLGSFLWEAADFHAGCLHGAADKPVTERECWCGVYAFTRAAHCRAQAKSTKMFAPHAMDPARFAGVVIGRVQLSSDAYLAKPARTALPEEWLATACRITRLYTDDSGLSERLAARYGVPVHTR
jgi:8-oxo-dGTP diphosphatase